MINKIYNYLELTDSIFSSGMPTAEQIPSLAEKNIEVVINLATSKSEGAIPNEQELVEAQNIKYYNIPVEWNNPTAEDLNEFFNIMKAHGDSKILVHCQANYRASCFITLHRILNLGLDQEQAYEDMNKIWDPQDYPIWETFISKSLESK
jgi:protein tyrosine phosphatase (PTP) superfamily phosphohydrolase (DUF442 family)